MEKKTLGKSGDFVNLEKVEPCGKVTKMKFSFHY